MIHFSRKKAMNLSEVMISMAVVGVLAVILIPLMLKTTTNKEKFLYAKAVNSLQNAISAVMGDYEAVNSSNFLPELSQNEDLRAQIASKLNAVGSVRADSESSPSSSSVNPDFYSNDGMVWWNVPEEWPAGENYIDINVDVNGTGGKNLASDDATSEEKPDQLKIRIMKDGRVVVPEVGSSDGDWSVETEYLMSRSSLK